jgi:hypothetical protein
MRGEDFSEAFSPFERTMGIDLVAQPIRAQVTARRRVSEDLVLSYLEEVLETDPVELQRRIDHISVTFGSLERLLSTYERACGCRAPENLLYKLGRPV